MTDISKDIISKRFVFIGDASTGKSTLVNAFVESNPSVPSSPLEKILTSSSENMDNTESQNGVETQKKETGSSNKNGTAIKGKEKKKEESSSENDEEETDIEDPKLLEEIDALLVYSTFKNNDQTYNLALWDSKTNSDFKDNRVSVYLKADAIILIYSVDTPKTFHNLSKKWRPHLKKNLKRNKKCPIILVGNKIDLRIKTGDDEESEDEDEEKSTVSTEEGKRLAKKIGAQEFFECSALNKEGIHEIFAKAATTAYEPTKGSKCLIS